MKSRLSRFFIVVLLFVCVIILTGVNNFAPAQGNASISRVYGMIETNGKRAYVPDVSSDIFFPPSGSYLTGKPYFSVFVRVQSYYTSDYYLRADEVVYPWNVYFDPIEETPLESTPVEISNGSSHDFEMRVSVPPGSSSQSVVLGIYESKLLIDPLVGSERHFNLKTDIYPPLGGSLDGGTGIGINRIDQSSYPSSVFFSSPYLIEDDVFEIVIEGVDNANSQSGYPSGMWKAELEFADNFGLTSSNQSTWQPLTPEDYGDGYWRYPFSGTRGHTYFFRAKIYDNVGNSTSTTILPVYIKRSFSVVVSSSPDPGGTVSGGGLYYEDGIDGANVVVTAVPNIGYQFVRWTVNGNTVSLNSEYSFTTNVDVELVAEFSLKTWVINASAGPGGSIVPSGMISVGDGSDQSFVISANPGYQVGSVFVDGVNQGAVSSHHFWDVTNDHTIEAYFVESSCTPPSIQSSAFSASNATASGMTISWNRGNGDGVLVVARAGNPVDSDPVNGNAYAANSNFGSGSEIGSGNYVVYNGIGSSVDLTGLTEETSYYLAIYEYYTEGNCFKIPPLTGSGITGTSGYCSAGSLRCEEYIARVSVGSIDNTSGCSTGGYGDYTIVQTDVIRGSSIEITVTNGNLSYLQDQCGVWVDWDGNGDFSDDVMVQVNGSPGGGPYTASLHCPADATPGLKRLRIRVHFNNETSAPCGNSEWGEVEDYSLNVIEGCTPPTLQSSAFSTSNISSNGMTISWNRGNGDGVLVVAREGNPVDSDPVNGNAYVANSNFGSGSEIGSGNYVVYNGTGSSVDLTGLTKETSYYLAIYEYYTEGNCYKIPPLTGNDTPTGIGYCTPAVQSLCDDYAEYICNVTIGTIKNITGCSDGGYMDYSALSTDIVRGAFLIITIQNGHGWSNDQCGVWVDWNNNFDFMDDPAIAVTGNPGVGPYTAVIQCPVNAIEGIKRVRVRINSTDNIISPCEFSYYGETEDYSLNVIDGCTHPTLQSSAFSTSNISSNGMTISWSRGNGDGVLVVARAGNPVDSDPVNGNAYVANSNFGSGSEIGSGNYVVYNGTGSSVDLTGLTEETSYYLAIYEYNTTGDCYITPALTGSAATIFQGKISLDVANLNFGSIIAGANSVKKSYTVTGSNLTSTITITAPFGFLIASNELYSVAEYTSSITVFGNTTNTIYVIFAPTLNASYNDVVLSHSSPGVETKFLTLNGTGTAVGGEDGSFIDSRDNHRYKFKEFGDQTWMIENLAFLPSVTPGSAYSSTVKHYYIYEYYGVNRDEAKRTDNYKLHGVLYNWPAAMDGNLANELSQISVKGVCPDGWHLPSDEEWQILEKFLGMSQEEAISFGERSSGNLGINMRAYNDGDNASGFSVLPSGIYSAVFYESFARLGLFSRFWSATGDNVSTSACRWFWYNGPNVSRYYSENYDGYSVRCVKDADEILSAPTIRIITQPTCAISTGSVVLDDLPESGTWTLTRTPGGTTITGTGTSITISGLAPGIYTYTVADDQGCISPASSNVVINAQPATPNAPTVGTISQPTVDVATGSVQLDGLPTTGIWTLTWTPFDISTTGEGSSVTIRGLEPGTYTFKVINSEGCPSEESEQVIIHPIPQINNLSKTSLCAGDILTIQGENFGVFQGSVFFNSISTVSIQSWSNSSIECIVPEGILPGSVYVLNFVGTSSSGYVYDGGTIDSPENLQASDGEYPDKVVISWSQVVGAISYNIYRGEVFVANVESLTFEDYGADYTTTIYSVSAIGACGEGNKNSDTGFLFRESVLPSVGINSTMSVWKRANDYLDIDFIDNVALQDVWYQIDSNDDTDQARWNIPTADGVAVLPGAQDNQGSSLTADWKISNADWDLLNQGMHIIYFKVVDDAGNVFITGDDEFSFTFGKDIVAPVIDFITPNEGQILDNNDVTISWNVIDDDSEGTPSGIDKQWISMDQNADFTELSREVASYLFEDLAEGEHSVFLKTRDHAGNESEMAELHFSVVLPHLPPIADAGTSMTVDEGDLVILEGYASYDPEGDPLTYQWTAPEGISLEGNETESPSFYAPEVNSDTTLSISLVVNDGFYDSEATTVEVSIKNITTNKLGSFKDSRDGQFYKTVKIGYQWWMADNLAWLPTVSSCGDGSMTEPRYYVFGYNETDKEEAKALESYFTYGVLYNWAAAMQGAVASDQLPSGVQGACPEGWHLPGVKEWEILYDYLGGSKVAGGKMKEAGIEHWETPNSGATNESGFTALPGGYHFFDYTCGYAKQYGGWWSTTEQNLDYAYWAHLHYAHGEFVMNSNTKGLGLSVRCVKDNKAPIAQAGNDQVVDAGELVTLWGSESSDPEGDSLFYTWIVPEGIEVEDCTLADLRFTAPVVDQDTEIIFGLKVSDGILISGEDQVKVTVRSISGECHFVPVWSGNGLDLMNINVVRATLDGTDLEPGDEIGLFDGTLCVGAARLNAVIDPTHILYMVASMDDGTGNGYTPGHPISYRLWDSSAGEESDAPGALYYDTNPQWSTSGLYEPSATAVVELTGYQEITQTVPLIAGWNLFSTHTLPEAPDLMGLLGPLVQAGKLIKVQDEQGRSIEDLGTLGGWTNMIGDLSAEEGYKIKVAGDCTPTFTGRPVPLPFEIPLTAGWNLIGFPGATAADGLKVVQELIDRKTLIKVQDEKGASVEDLSPFGGWVNNIGLFRPGEGYKVKVTADEVLTIQEAYTRGGQVGQAALPPIHFTTKVRGNGTDHMNIHLVGLPEGILVPGDEIGVFDGEHCVGAVKVPDKFLAGIAEGAGGTGGGSPESPGHAEQVQSGRLQTLSMAISANDGVPGEGFTEGHPFTLRLWKVRENRELLLEPEILMGSPTFVKHESTFASFAKYGTTGSPLITVGRAEAFTLYPNPTTGKVYLTINSRMLHGATWQLLNAAGQLLREELLEERAVEVDLAGYAKGVYYLKVKGEDGTEVKKIMLQ